MSLSPRIGSSTSPLPAGGVVRTLSYNVRLQTPGGGGQIEPFAEGHYTSGAVVRAREASEVLLVSTRIRNEFLIFLEIKALEQHAQHDMVVALPGKGRNGWGSRGGCGGRHP